MKNLPNNKLKDLNEKALAQLKALQGDDDTEAAHQKADMILTCLLEDLGFYDLVSEYDEIGKWYA